MAPELLTPVNHHNTFVAHYASVSVGMGDGFVVNQIGHPYQGSFTWEAFGESQRGSLNDLVAATFGSASIGEMLHLLYLEARPGIVPFARGQVFWLFADMVYSYRISKHLSTGVSSGSPNRTAVGPDLCDSVLTDRRSGGTSGLYSAGTRRRGPVREQCGGAAF
jgi:hypothetical protein